MNLDEVNKQVQVKYPYLQFLNNNGARSKSTVRDNRCGHTWETSHSRVRREGIGIRCPVCNKTNRKKTTESLLAEIHALGFTTIVSIGKYSGAKETTVVNYECGHSDTFTPTDLLGKGAKSRCVVCNPQKYQVKSPEIFKEEVSAIAPHLRLLDEYSRDSVYIRVTDDECGHIWKINPHNFLQKLTLINCPVCKPISKYGSKGQNELADYIRKHTPVIIGTRALVPGYELDIYVPSVGLVIEYNGEYWHSDLHKTNSYHLEKKLTIETTGLRVIHIFEHEWRTKQEIVKSRILSMLNKCYSLGARRTEVKEIPYPKDFLNTNHLQGCGSPTSINLGLFLYDELVATMTFSKPRFDNNHEYELVRYCTLLDINIQGGASKLLKYFTKMKNNPSIVSYADRRWSNGRLYEQLGFTLLSTSAPGYFYFNNSSNLITRYAAQKHKLPALFPQFYHINKTEKEIMKEAGYFRVYDCGMLVYSLNCKSINGIS